MVKSAVEYVDDAALVTRSYVATDDLSWSSRVSSTDEVIAKVRSRDVRVGVQLELMLAFGLRRKEAIMFCPHLAVVPFTELQELHQGKKTYLTFLRVKRGTKGGRLRFTPVRTPEQQQALAHARELARSRLDHIGHPGLTLKQSLNLFTNTVRACGVTKAVLGVTPHGLRHQFAGDLFFDLTTVDPPVRGKTLLLDPDAMRAAYLEVSRQLGHERPGITSVYLGSRRPSAWKGKK